jgi:hypothetical protein
VIAVKVDNTNSYQEEATGTEYQWMGRAFNPKLWRSQSEYPVCILRAGSTKRSHSMRNLQTTGIYVYGSNFDVKNKACDVTVESQVRNEKWRAALRPQ